MMISHSLSYTALLFCFTAYAAALEKRGPLTTVNIGSYNPATFCTQFRQTAVDVSEQNCHHHEDDCSVNGNTAQVYAQNVPFNNNPAGQCNTSGGPASGPITVITQEVLQWMGLANGGTGNGNNSGDDTTTAQNTWTQTTQWQPPTTTTQNPWTQPTTTWEPTTTSTNWANVYAASVTDTSATDASIVNVLDTSSVVTSASSAASSSSASSSSSSAQSSSQSASSVLPPPVSGAATNTVAGLMSVWLMVLLHLV